MRKVILSMFLTLDGLTGGPNGEMDWVTPDQAVFDDLLDVFDTVDTNLLGGGSYQPFTDYWPSTTTEEASIADKMNMTPKIVFSKTLETVEWGKWNNITVVKGDIVEEVSKMKQQPGKDMLLFGGAGIVRSFIQHDLIDEYRLVINPIVLGNGKPLFQQGEKPVHLQLIRSKIGPLGVAILYYAPEKG